MAIKDKYKVERKYITNKLARGGKKLVSGTPRYFVAHETANNSADADAHYKYFQGIEIQASAHTFVDDKKILEIIPTNEKAWHVQYNQDKRTLGLGYANDYAVGTELCRTGSFADAYDRYVWYHAYLCHKYSKQPKKHITAHKFEDPQRRSDPQSWLEPNGVTWTQFINDVQTYYDSWNKSDVSKPSTPTKPSQPKDKANLKVDGYWGRQTTKALQQTLGTVADGEIWGQVRNQATQAVTGGVKFGTGGSPVIVALQKKVNSKADGYLGANTIRSLQMYLKTPADGELWKPSTMVRELQRRLNAGTF